MASFCSDAKVSVAYRATSPVLGVKAFYEQEDFSSLTCGDKLITPLPEAEG